MLKELVERKVLRVVSGYAVVCFVVLQIADVTFEPLDITPDTLRSIIAIMILGFPVVTYLAWIFDVSDNRELVKHSSSLVETGLLVAALALFGGGIWFSLYSNSPLESTSPAGSGAEEKANNEQPTVVVVPFTNMSADAEQDYFVAGLSEELISALSTSRELAVVARSSSFALKDRPLTIREISELVNASHVVEGSVRKRGEHIRVTVTLSEVASGTQLWANSFDRTLGDIFKMQENIANSVASTLHVQLERPSTNPAAIDSPAHPLYLQARGILSLGSRTRESIEIAEKSLDDALALDPNYVPALLEKSRLLLRQEQLQLTPAGSLQDERTSLLNRALDIAPDHPTANAYMGWNWVYAGRNPQRGLEYYHKALELAPYEPEILRGLAVVLLHLNHPELGRDVAKFVTERDPLCGICFRTLANAHLMLGEYQACADVLKLTLEIAPSRELQYLRALVLTKAGQHEEAKEVAQSLSPIPQSHVAGIVSILEGEPDALSRSLQNFQTLYPHWHPAVAEFYLLAGQTEQSVAYILSFDPTATDSSALNMQSIYLEELASDPRLQDIRRMFTNTPPEDVKIDFEILAIRD